MPKVKGRNEMNEGFLSLLRSPIDYKSLMEALDFISRNYPFAGITYMGTSVLGRGIPMVTLGGERGRCKSVLYVGTHHGMEHITSAVLLRFIVDYCEAVKRGGRLYTVSMERLFTRRTVHIIPQLNVDGADLQINGAEGCILRDRLVGINGSEDFSHWQANARGVDLNHNYDAGFEEYKKLERELGIDGPAPTRFSGEGAESEPECAYITALLRFSEEIRGVLTLHTQGEEIYSSWSGKRIRGADNAMRLISKMTGYRMAYPEGPAAYGGLTDWCVGKLGLPSFTLECGKGTNPLPYCELDTIYKRLRELLFTFPLIV